MIFDRIENAKQYLGIHPGIDQVLAAVAEYTPENYQTGKLELDGDRAFLLRNQYETACPDNAVFEAHQKYADVMYMVEGEEIIYVKPTSLLKNITKPYDPAIEALLADRDADGTPLRLTAGSFVVLFPQDAHAPGCWIDAPKTVKKIVGKVKL